MRKRPSNLMARFRIYLLAKHISHGFHRYARIKSLFLNPCESVKSVADCFSRRLKAKGQRRLLIRPRVATQFIGDHDSFGHLPHRFAGLPTLSLQSQVCLFFVDGEVALQNAFRAFHDLSRFQLL
jgi:hypothetical protein